MLEFESIPKSDFKEATLTLPNPLDKRITASEPTITFLQPEGSLDTGTPRPVRYDIVIPPKIVKKLKDETAKKAADRKKIPLRVSVFWGAPGDNIGIYGLRHFFTDSEDTILVGVEGFEDRGKQGGEPKNVGFHKLYLDKLVARLKTDHSTIAFELMDLRISILSGYSTGYGGMGQSVNNDFFELKFIERMIFFDCLYRGDKPALPKGEKAPTLLPEEDHKNDDEVDKGHATSAFNTRRAIIRIQKAQETQNNTLAAQKASLEKEKTEAEKLPAGPARDKKIKDIDAKLVALKKNTVDYQSKQLNVIAYAVSSAGSPKYKGLPAKKYPYTVFVPVLIDLREDFLREALFVLSITRAFDAAKKQGLVTEAEIPASYRTFIPKLLKRGEIRSGSAAKSGAAKTLKEWGDDNKGSMDWKKAAAVDITKAVGIITDKTFFYVGYPGSSNAGGMLHIGHLVEFGGEFLR